MLGIENNRLVLVLRLLGGGLIGLAVAMFLLIGSQTVFPVLSPVIMGLQFLLGKLFLNIFSADSEYVEYLFHASMIFYAATWMTVGALLSSGQSKLITIGSILLVIYVLAGGIVAILHFSHIMSI